MSSQSAAWNIGSWGPELSIIGEEAFEICLSKRPTQASDILLETQADVLQVDRGHRPIIVVIEMHGKIGQISSMHFALGPPIQQLSAILPDCV